MIYPHPLLPEIFDRINAARNGDSGRQWKGHCPAHDDAKMSLTVGLGDDDQILFNCKANCSQEAVREAFGYTWAELGSPYRNQPRKTKPSNRQPFPQRSAQTKKTSDEIVLLLANFREQTTPQQHLIGIHRWADHLGLSPESSSILGDVWQPDRIASVVVGDTIWRPDMSAPGLLLTPMVDGDLTVVGSAIRDWSGAKWRVAGGSEGLFVPSDFPHRVGPVFLVEGPTDTRAAWEMGLAVIGRSNNKNNANISQLAQLLRSLSPSREIIVVGENDRKPSGNWPGRTGADETARELSRLLNRPVRAALVAESYKDTREWYQATIKTCPHPAESFRKSLTFFASYPLLATEVTDEELIEAATLPFDPRQYYAHPEETCPRPGHMLLRNLDHGNLRNSLNRCGSNSCPQCFARKKRLRYESLCRHFDALQLRGGQLHTVTRTFTKQEWDSCRRFLLRHDANFIRVRLSNDLFVLIATHLFPGSESLPFGRAKDFLKQSIDQAVVEGRGKPFCTSSKNWAMVREKAERQFEKLGTVKLPPQAVKRLCKQHGIKYQQKRPPDASLLLYGDMAVIADKAKEESFVQMLLSKPDLSESHILYMHDSDKSGHDDSQIKGLPPGWDDWFAWWMNPTA